MSGDNATYTNPENVTINHGSTWNIALLITIFLVFIGWILYTRRSPDDRKRDKLSRVESAKTENEIKLLNDLINKIVKGKLDNDK